MTFVGERRIRDLNREHRGKDEVTDVLSFPLEDWEPRTRRATAADGGPLRHGRAAALCSATS